MGALAQVRKNIKNSRIGLVIGGAFGAFSSMVNSIEIDENKEYNIDEAINETIKENPEMADELATTRETIADEQVSLEEKASKQFSSNHTFGPELDEDGYYKIENKLKGIKAEVSETEAVKENSEREKNGRQKTRFDED